MRYRIIFLLLIKFTIISYLRCQEVGETCTVEQTSHEGVCELIKNCPSVLSALSKRRKYTSCKFLGNIEVVCCPNIRQNIGEIQMTTTAAPRTISEKKCLEYSKAGYELAPSAVFDGEATFIRRCGFSTTPLILGGQDAHPLEFPHMAAIGGYPENGGTIKIWNCGGSLISDQFVLTAAHCVYGRKELYILLGDLNTGTNTDDAIPEEFNVTQVIMHPNYTAGVKYNDIALLKLDHKVDFDSYKRPACLANTFDVKESKAIASGWGHTMHKSNPSDHLLKVTLDKFSSDECSSAYAEYGKKGALLNGILDASQICAGSKTDEKKDTCQGDSGGPLQVYHNLECMYKIIGITSFGAGCGIKPGVYTRVYAFLDWIEGIVWNNESL